MGNMSKRGWSFGISGCAGCPFFVLFHREKVWRGLHLDRKKFWKRQKTRVWDEKSFWKFWKKFSLRVLFWPQFGEKTGVRGTVEEGLGEFWGGNAQRIFQKYFECFFFSLPQLREAKRNSGFGGRFVNRPYYVVSSKSWHLARLAPWESCQRKLTERAKTHSEEALSVTPSACHLSRSERLTISFLENSKFSFFSAKSLSWRHC